MAASLSEEERGLVEEMFVQAIRDHGNMRGRQLLCAATFVGMLNACITLLRNGQLNLDDARIRRVVYQFQPGIYYRL